jgi:hypothetical protein
MSYTEINSREGLPDGGMPYDVILRKLEETDADLVEEVRGTDEFYDLRDEYDGYARSEIIDWSPDAPFLESDHPSRDPAVSRSRLNLQYNGTRGSHPELPRHPELFYGFTGNDPRGMGTDPRFDQMRGAITSRAADLTVRMGNNDDFALAERPWTNQSISYGMKDLQERLKANTKIFSVQREGRPWGNNVVANEFAAAAIRAAEARDGIESFEPGFAAGDHGRASDAETGGLRGVDGRGDSAPWRNSVGDADLGVHQYGQNRGAGRTSLAPGAVGGGRVRAGRADADWAESRRGDGARGRAVLGATMALAARHRAAAKSGVADQAHGVSHEGRAVGAGLVPAEDLARIHRAVVEDQSRRAAGEVQDGDRLGPARGVAPSAQPGHAARGTVAATTPNAHLTNVEAIVAGLREGSAAARRRIAGAVSADGARNLAASELFGGTRRGAPPTHDRSRRAVDASIARSAAAGLAVHVYGAGAPARANPRLAGRTYDGAAWRASREALAVGRSRPPEWRSATQGQTALGDADANVFGFDSEAVGGGAPVGPKRLRADAGSDSMGLHDEMDEFGD